MITGVVVGTVLFVLARQFELAGRPERWVALVMTVIVVESFVYPSQIDVPVGLFRIPILRGGMRTFDVLVVIGLAARATVRPLRGRIRIQSALWFVTGVWFATAAVRGLVSGNLSNQVLFSAGSVVGLVGGFMLVSGCDPTRLADLFRARYLITLGIIVAVLIVSEARAEPLALFGTVLGEISVDSASVFLVIATFGVLVEWSRRPRSNTAVWLCIPMLIAPFTIEQRATLLHLGASVVVVIWAVAGSEWNDRIQVTRVTLLWATMLVIGVLMGVLMFNLGQGEGDLPLADYYHSTFQSVGQQQSAQARRESFSIGIEEWREQPVFGHGLGHRYTVVRPGAKEAVVASTFDNVPLDVLVRTGAVGLVFFVAANVASVVAGWRMWKLYPDRVVGALALAATVALIGLSVKAGFESILEKGKLAIVWGMTAGVIAAVQRRFDRATPADIRQDHEHQRFEGVQRWT